MAPEQKKMKIVFGELMVACPRCGEFDIRIQVSHSRGSSSELEGSVYMVCGHCGHHGPSMDCKELLVTGLSFNKTVFAEIKRLWNSQTR